MVKADTPTVAVTEGNGQYCAPWIVESPGGTVTTSAYSGYLTVVLREIRRLGSGFSKVDSVFLKKSQPGACTVYAPGCVFFLENGVDLGKPRPQTSDLAWVRYHQQKINCTFIMPLMLR